ncbi:MAG: exonuclease SbcCD subunit D [Thiohalocapsa sp.]|jgi:exonuclease SbcD|uniref:exonuclease SbcCD subunit D n=1 Tax=Thiohalocapsa sp. TaxID=2497641 RepID=UPI0025FE14E2|nr:exonuclease SbcCD subunit D [Thiohalocapsa sp.]MCG6940770.1 exonuclease SbcCD subunit D [Thiohalocapsa sp.]
MPFRLLHTADWHLGRVFFNVSLLDDQAHALEQLVALARDTRADALVIAGDVYDRAVPPADAVRLLDETLRHIALDLELAVVIIAGNHDSAERLGFGAALMEERRCFVRGPLNGDIRPIEIAGRDGAARFHPLPYAEPAVVREHLANPELTSHDAAIGALVAGLGPLRRDLPNIAIGHCFVTGGYVSESERPLSVGGAGQVSAEHFAGFDYAALGHLHRPQAAGEQAHYSGSLLKYSFSEATHAKSVTLVELDAGQRHLERIALTPRRDLRIIEGHLAELLQGPPPGESADDYLLVRLLDTGALLDPMGRLRAVYPNALHLERPTLEQAGDGRGPSREQLARGDEALFADFFNQVTGSPLVPDQQAVLHDVLGDLRRQEREAGVTPAPQPTAPDRT